MRYVVLAGACICKLTKGHIGGGVNVCMRCDFGSFPLFVVCLILIKSIYTEESTQQANISVLVLDLVLK